MASYVGAAGVAAAAGAGSDAASAAAMDGADIFKVAGEDDELEKSKIKSPC